MSKENNNNKIKFSVIISITSLIIAFVSLGFSIYKFNIETSFKDTQFSLAQSNTEFEQTYKKISLVEQNQYEQYKNCDYDIDKSVYDENMRLIDQSRNALLSDNPGQALSLLKQVGIICESYITEVEPDDTIKEEIITISSVWIILIISFIILRFKK